MLKPETGELKPETDTKSGEGVERGAGSRKGGQIKFTLTFLREAIIVAK